jgi:hypothetical protein
LMIAYRISRADHCSHPELLGAGPIDEKPRALSRVRHRA